MPISIDLAPLLALPEDERRAIVEALRESLSDEEFAYELSPEFKAELDRRVADAIANPDAGIPWDVVRARLAARGRQ